MTFESRTEYAAEFITFGLPDVPYSQVHIYLADEQDFDAVMAQLADFRRAYLAAFSEPQEAPQQSQQLAPQRSTAPTQGNGPRPAQRPQQERYVDDGGRVHNEGLLCPTCRQPLEEYSNDTYAKWELDETDGFYYEQSFACSTPACLSPGKKTKAVWRSQAVRAS